MTPEDDVNKESEQDGTANAESEPVKQATKAAVEDVSGVSAKNAADSSSGSSTGSSAKKAKEETETGSEPSVDADTSPASDEAGSAQAEVQDDIEKAASEQSASADDDDPLGFGNKRMDGDADDEDAESSVQGKLTEAEAKVASQADQLVRMQAEMENQRKRAQNDVTKAHKFALEKIALDLLPVRDSLEMGLQAATGDDAEPEKIIEGSELTLKMLTQALEKYNINEINPMDEKFDPEFHQAMSMQPVEGKEPNTVAGVMQKGYTLNDRLIRPALVMVAK